MVVPTNEELAIARKAAALLSTRLPTLTQSRRPGPGRVCANDGAG